MKQAANESPTPRSANRFDDEITLPLRIVCGRKGETVHVYPAGEGQAKDIRQSNGDQKPVRAA